MASPSSHLGRQEVVLGLAKAAGSVFFGKEESFLLKQRSDKLQPQNVFLSIDCFRPSMIYSGMEYVLSDPAWRRGRTR